MPDLRRIDALTDAHARDLLDLYEREWWTSARSLDDIRRMLRHSDVVVGFTDERERLIAFARALTDRTFKALIFDVIVAPEYRGTGLGGRLMDAIIAHPTLSEVRHFELYCQPDMVSFYRRWGFTTDLGGVRLMRLTRPEKQ